MSIKDVQDRSHYYYLSGKRIEITEDPKVFAVGFRPGKRLDNASLTPASKRVLEDSNEISFIPQYNLRIFESSRSAMAEDDILAASIERLDDEDQISFASMAVRRSGNEGNLSFITRRFVVSFKAHATDQQIAALHKETGAQVLEKLKYVARGYLMEAERATGPRGTIATANIYFESGLCDFSHADFIERRYWRESEYAAVASRSLQTKIERDGEFVSRQWHLSAAKVIEAWAITPGSSTISIAVLDDGIDVAHEEFAGKLRAQFDFQSNLSDGSPKASDDNHGTACAGVATAAGIKASGVAPGCQLIAVRTPAFLGVADEAEMFRWTADQGADVISCSWGPSDNAGPFALVDNVRAAINYCSMQGRNGLGIPIFFAAGNGNELVSDDGYASNPDVMAVAASSSRGTRSPYSDFGPEIFINAPSSGDSAAGDPRIFTTDRLGPAGYNAGDISRGDALGNYTSRFGGTSSACPLVAGVAALILSVDSALTRNQVREILKSTADKIGGVTYDSNGHNDEFGYGRVNAMAAVQMARNLRSGGAGTSAISAPASAGPSSPPTFKITLGSRRLYAIELASRQELLDPAKASLRTSSNHYESWSGGLRSDVSFTPTTEVWSSLATEGQVYYLAHFADDNSWSNYFVSSPFQSAPSVQIASSGTPTGRHPAVIGPTSAQVNVVPVFQVQRGKHAMYALEFATDASLFESANAHLRTPGNHYGSWVEGLASGSTYSPPADIWSSLAGGTRVYYRGHFADDANWSNYLLVPTDSFPSITIIRNVATGTDGTTPEGEVRYPSNAVFKIVNNPTDGIDYSDPVGNEVIPLIEVRGRGEEKLSTNFQVKELAAPQVRYARISPKLVEVLQAMRNKLGQGIKIDSGYRHPALNLAVGDQETNEQISGRAAKIRAVATSTKPIDLARLAIESTQEPLGLGLGPRCLHIEVTGNNRTWVDEDAPMSDEAFANAVNSFRKSRVDRMQDAQDDEFALIIDGPGSLERTAMAPSFHILSKDNRYYAVEIATDPRLLNGIHASLRTQDNFYGTWSDPVVGLLEVGVDGRANFTLPEYAWKRLRRAASLFYRVLSSADRSKNWSNYQTSLADPLCLDAPRIRIVDRVVAHEDERTANTLRRLIGSHEQDADSWNQ